MTMSNMSHAIKTVQVFVAFLIKHILFGRFGNFHILEPFNFTFIPIKGETFPIITRRHS